MVEMTVFCYSEVWIFRIGLSQSVDFTNQILGFDMNYIFLLL